MYKDVSHKALHHVKMNKSAFSGYNVVVKNAGFRNYIGQTLTIYSVYS